MTTQMQHAVRVQMMVDQFMENHKARGYNTRLQRFLEEDCGYKFLGGGYFSIVVLHPENPDLVIKVNVGCGERGEFAKGPCGDGYMDYVAACMRAPKSKHLPEFHAAVVGKNCAIVIMRRYQTYKPYTVSSDKRSVSNDVIEVFNGCYSKLNDPGIRYVLDVMGPASDLHNHNYMWDDCNQCVVITDPYTFRAPGQHDRVERYLQNGKVVVDVQLHRIEEPPAVARGAEALNDFNVFAQQMFRVDNEAIRKIHEAALKVDLDPAPFVVHKGREVECLNNSWLPNKVEDDHNARSKVVADCEKPSLRDQEKDNVLHIRSKYDRPAQPVRVQGTLLPRQDARRLRTARTIKHGTVGREAGGIILDAGGPVERSPERLHVSDTSTKHDVAT